MSKLYAIEESDFEEESNGVSIISGPDKVDLEKLYKEYCDKDAYKHITPKLKQPTETQSTGSFSEWLIKFKRFSRPKIKSFYIPSIEEEGHIKLYQSIRDSASTPRNMKEVEEKIEKIKKTMVAPVVREADDPSLMCKGWIVYDSKNEEENCEHILIPIQWLREGVASYE